MISQLLRSPMKGPGFIQFFISGTMLTLVNLSWVSVKMFREWESCLLCLIYFLIHGFLTLWYSFPGGDVCFSRCQALVMLEPLLGWSADPSSVRSVQAPLGRTDLSYPLHTPLLWHAEAGCNHFCLFTGLSSMQNLRWNDMLVTRVLLYGQIWMQFTHSLLDVCTWERHWPSLTFCSFLYKVGII